MPEVPPAEPRFLDDPYFRPVSGGMGKLEPIPQDHMEVWGEVYVKNGDTEFRARNKIVGQGLRHLINSIWGSNAGITFGTMANTALNVIRLGTGSGTTVDGTTSLTTEVGTAPTTVTHATSSPVGGTYRYTMTATWNSGTIAALTITEIGIKGRLMATMNSPNTVVTDLLFARLSVTDSEFSSFVIDNTKPLVVEYRCSISFV